MARLDLVGRPGARLAAAARVVRVALALLVAGCTLSACGGGGGVAPVVTTGQAPAAAHGEAVHVVREGDTLYGIAWESGVDYRDLAHWNAIPEPFTIYPGQRIRLTPPGPGGAVRLPAPPAAPPPATVATTPPSTTSPASAVAPASKPVATAPRAPATPPAPPTPPPAAPARKPAIASAAPPASSVDWTDNRPVHHWVWPTHGRVIGAFAHGGGKGIDIGGEQGQPILAAATGRVVYCGGGLRGYGQLIILKHNKRFLSAYAHNSRVFVKEGDVVTVGQRIADMGSSGTNRVKLHFEIRLDGKPVDPVRYLPRRNG